MKNFTDLKSPTAAATVEAARVYSQRLVLDPDSYATTTKKIELFAKLDNLITKNVCEDNLADFREILCAPYLVPKNGNSKQTASIDLFLEYIHETGKDFRLAAFLKNCPEDKLEFWAKVKLQEVYKLISETAYQNATNNGIDRCLTNDEDKRIKSTENFLKLEAVINIIKEQANEKLLYLVLDTFNDIIKNIAFVTGYSDLPHTYDCGNFHEFCRHNIITIIESLKNPTSKVVPMLCDLIAKKSNEFKKSDHAEKAQELLLHLIAQDPALLVIDLNGTKRLSLLNDCKYSADGKSIFRDYSSAGSTKDFITQVLTHKALQYLEELEVMAKIEPKKPELNILNQALSDAIHDNNFGAIEALFKAKASQNWPDKQQFIHLLCSKRFISAGGLACYLELDLKKSTAEDCTHIENFLKEISHEATQILAIENFLQMPAADALIIQVFNFLAKNPNLCQKIKFEQLSISVEIKDFDTAKNLATLIWDHKNTAILLPLLKLMQKDSIKSEHLTKNLATIIKKTTIDNVSELAKTIGYLEGISKELYFPQRWCNLESNTLYKLKPNDYRGLFWRPNFFEQNPANNTAFDDKNAENSSLVGEQLKIKSRSRCENCVIS